MRLLRTDVWKLEEWHEPNLPEYAILSHTWLQKKQGEVEKEVLFTDMNDFTAASLKEGWKKVDFARRRAALDGFQHVWIDSCCIDKMSSAELSESLNSMYRWYETARVCYVFLEDMDCSSATFQGDQSTQKSLQCTDEDSDDDQQDIQSITLAKCRWFRRGWTLQEMIASRNAVLFDKAGRYFDTLRNRSQQIADITGVHEDLLTGKRTLGSFSVAQRMNWASHRETTRPEDQAYSLLGIFDISLPIVYGEGERAFQRLQDELLRVYSDHTIFAWGYQPSNRSRYENEPGKDMRHSMAGMSSRLLARSPKDFAGEAVKHLVSVKSNRTQREYEIMGKSILFDLPFRGQSDDPNGENSAILSCTTEIDCTLFIRMNLLVSSSGDFLRRSICECDYYDVLSLYKSRQFNVLRKPVTDTESHLRPGLAFETHSWILFRAKDQAMSRLPAKSASGYIDWSHRQTLKVDWQPEIDGFKVPRRLKRPVSDEVGPEDSGTKQAPVCVFRATVELLCYQTVSFSIEAEITFDAARGLDVWTFGRSELFATVYPSYPELWYDMVSQPANMEISRSWFHSNEFGLSDTVRVVAVELARGSRKSAKERLERFLSTPTNVCLSLIFNAIQPTAIIVQGLFIPDLASVILVGVAASLITVVVHFFDGHQADDTLVKMLSLLDCLTVFIVSMAITRVLLISQRLRREAQRVLI